VFELSSFLMDARSKSSTLVVNSHVASRLFKATPDVDQPPFIHATDFCLVDTMLHDNPDLVIDWVQICWDIWMPEVLSGGMKSDGVSWSRRSTVSHARFAECIYKVVQQHNLGEVANSIPHLCTETS